MIVELSNDSSNDEVADTHNDSSRDQDRLSAPSIEVEDRRDGSQEHCHTDYSRGEQGDAAPGKTDRLEDERSVVKDEID